MSEVNHTALIEEWRDIAGYEGHYQVSNMGRVKSLARKIPSKRHPSKWKHLKERIMKPSRLKKCGHRTIMFRVKNKWKSFYVHRLVLEAFIGPCPEGMECCHFPDRDTSNNRLDNLRWDTTAANLEDAKKHGTRGGEVETALRRKAGLKRWERVRQRKLLEIH